MLRSIGPTSFASTSTAASATPGLSWSATHEEEKGEKSCDQRSAPSVVTAVPTQEAAARSDLSQDSSRRALSQLRSSCCSGSRPPTAPSSHVSSDAVERSSRDELFVLILCTRKSSSTLSDRCMRRGLWCTHTTLCWLVLLSSTAHF